MSRFRGIALGPIVALIVGAALPHAAAAAPARPSTSTSQTPKCHGERATLAGTNEADVIWGTRRADVIVARGGDDLVHARGGSDLICAGVGDDNVHAGRGFDDSVYAAWGADVVHGGPGRNLMVAGPGNDRMYGGPNFDNFESPKRDWTKDLDLFVGRGRSDEFSADPGPDTFKGGKGRDRVSYFRSPDGVDVDLRLETASGDGRDTLLSIEDVIGSHHSDTIKGDNGGNDIFSSTGFDTVYGFGGNDELLDSGG